jgi:O-antigen/teichoic acid export membrane protein
VLFIFAPEAVVRTILGAKFLAASPVLQWFGLAFVPMFTTALFPYVFTALARQGGFFLITGIALVLRLVLELLLIPKFGYMAACVIAAGCEIFAFAAFFLMLTWRRIWRVGLDSFVKPAFAGSIMAIVLVGGQRYFGQGGLILTVGLVLVGGLGYVGVLFGTGVFSKAELLLAKEALSFVGPYLRSFRRKPGALL